MTNFCTFARGLSDNIYRDLIHIITGRNEVVAKVIFLHLSVILFTGGMCLRQPPQVRQPPGSDTPQSRQPPWVRHHPPQEQTTPLGQTPPGQTPPLGADTPRSGHPPGSILRHTVHERPVRILLECILVISIISFEYSGLFCGNCLLLVTQLEG